MVHASAARVSPTALTQRQFLELINNTALGTVCSPRQLQRMREAAGSRLGKDGKISLPAVAAWLRQRVGERRAKAALKSTAGIAAAPELLRRLTLEQLAQLLRVNPRVARRWRDDQGLPVARSGPDAGDGDRYDLVEVCAWFAHRKGMKAMPREDEDNLESAKVKKLNEEIRQLMLKNGRLAGETVAVTAVGVVGDALGTAFDILSGRLESIFRSCGEAAMESGQQALGEVQLAMSEAWGPLRLAWQAAGAEYAANIIPAGAVLEDDEHDEAGDPAAPGKEDGSREEESS